MTKEKILIFDAGPLINFSMNGFLYLLEELKKSFQKLRLSDPAIKLEPDSNEVLGRGFKAGFLGKLHFEITSQRLEREFNVRTVNSFPSVAYKVKKSSQKDEYTIIENPKDLSSEFAEIWEPIVDLEILTSLTYLGSIMNLRDSFSCLATISSVSSIRIVIKSKSY